MDIMETIREQIEENRIILYMKGSPNQPQCGFSCLLYTSPSPRDMRRSRMPSSA